MNRINIALRGAVAMLMALSLAACLVTQNIGLIVNPATGQLLGFVAPGVWDLDDASELDLFRAALGRQDIELTNAGLTSTTGSITIAVLDDYGSVISSSTFDYVIDPSDKPFRLRIAPADLWAATSFVRNLAANPAATRVVLTPDSVGLQPIDDGQPVEVCVDLYYKNTLRDSECAVWPPMS